MPEEMTTTETTTTTEAPPSAPETTQQEAPQQAIKPALFDEPPEPSQTEPPQTPDTTEQPQTEKTSEPEQLTAKDITLPEGTTYDEELGNSFLGIANEYHIPKEAVQKFADMYYAQQIKILEGLKAAEAERVKKFEADMAAEKAEWLKQCMADTEYGGQKWEASQAVIDRGCKEIATPEAVNLMQRYNLNTHPEIVRMFFRAGLMAGEDSSRIAGTGTGKPSNPAMAIFGDSLKDYHKRRGDIN